jgi:hypothetical protein
MQVALSHIDLWLKFAIAGLFAIILFRFLIFKHTFLGRALICFSAGLALFSVLCFFFFKQLIQVQEYDAASMQLLSDEEMQVRYYYWYLAAIAFALSSVINFVWLLNHKAKNRIIFKENQAKIVGVSFTLGFGLVLLVVMLLFT